MYRISIAVSLLRFTFQHWKYLIFEANQDIKFETAFFFDTLNERVRLWNE